MEQEVLAATPPGEYLDICERSLRKYITLHEDNFDVDQAIKMLECNVICKNNLHNEIYGDMICFLCASVCIDCLDPQTAFSTDEIDRKYERIHHYIRLSHQHLAEREKYHEN